VYRALTFGFCWLRAYAIDDRLACSHSCCVVCTLCSHSTVACTNTAGSRTCGGCRAGMSGDGTNCVNVNECQTANGGCNGTTPVCTDLTPSATNGWATRTCSACGVGFAGAVGGCVDINECASNSGGCAALTGGTTRFLYISNLKCVFCWMFDGCECSCAGC
jgi:hypothetical protein